MMHTKEILNPTEAAEYLGLCRSTLDKARVYGTLRIPFCKIGRRVVYRKMDLDAYLEASRRTHVDGSEETSHN